jgi:predicted acyltransferase
MTPHAATQSLSLERARISPADAVAGATAPSGGRITAPPAPARLLSLDALRGTVVAGMLLVNNMIWTAATPRQLMHAPWGTGMTFTDMILPWFVLVVGIAIPAAGRRRAGGRHAAVRVLRRAAVLVALGILIDSAASRALTIGMDVLQLLGLSYLAAVPLARTPAWSRLATAGGLLAAYGGLLTLVAAPGLPPGVFQEHRNVIQYINDTYLARFALAGVLAVAPAAALALIGTVAGDVLLSERIAVVAKPAVFAAAGAALGAAGAAWARWLPLSKDLWTPPYALVAGGLGLLVLAACHLCFEVARLRRLAVPLAVLGSNPLVGYVASALFAVAAMQTWPNPWSRGGTLALHPTLLDPLGGAVGAVAAGWIYTGSVIALWWLVLFALYRRRIFIRV